MTTELIGKICDNTCFGFQVGDNTPDYFNLFGAWQLSGPVDLVINAASYDLTINNHTLSFGFSDPWYHISFTNAVAAGFGPGSFEFFATGGPLNPFGFTNIYGFAAPETEYICAVAPGVPEPATWALFIAGVMIAGCLRGLKRLQRTAA